MIAIGGVRTGPATGPPQEAEPARRAAARGVAATATVAAGRAAWTCRHHPDVVDHRHRPSGRTHPTGRLVARSYFRPYRDGRRRPPRRQHPSAPIVLRVSTSVRVAGPPPTRAFAVVGVGMLVLTLIDVVVGSPVFGEVRPALTADILVACALGFAMLEPRLLLLAAMIGGALEQHRGVVRGRRVHAGELRADHGVRGLARLRRDRRTRVPHRVVRSIVARARRVRRARRARRDVRGDDRAAPGRRLRQRARSVVRHGVVGVRGGRLLSPRARPAAARARAAGSPGRAHLDRPRAARHGRPSRDRHRRPGAGGPAGRGRPARHGRGRTRAHRARRRRGARRDAPHGRHAARRFGRGRPGAGGEPRRPAGDGQRPGPRRAAGSGVDRRPSPRAPG